MQSKEEEIRKKLEAENEAKLEEMLKNYRDKNDENLEDDVSFGNDFKLSLFVRHKIKGNNQRIPWNV